MNIYIEYLCIKNFLKILFFLSKKNIFFKKNYYFYIDSSNFFNFLITLNNLFNFLKFYKLEFRLSDIQDKKKELVKLRLERKDLFDIQDYVVSSKLFHNINPNVNSNSFFYDYMKKSITDGHIIMEPESMNRAIFIINVVNYHINKNDIKKSFFFISKRPWEEIIKEYGKKNNLEIFFVPKINKFKYKYFYQRYLIRFKEFFNISSFFNLNFLFFNKDRNINYRNKIFLKSPGYFNFEKNIYNSDFFINHNSNLSFDDIIYPPINKKQSKILKSKNVDTGKIDNNYFHNYKNFNYKNIIQKKIQNYNNEYSYCKSL